VETTLHEALVLTYFAKPISIKKQLFNAEQYTIKEIFAF